MPNIITMQWVFVDQINHFVIKSQDSLSISLEKVFFRVTGNNAVILKKGQ